MEHPGEGVGPEACAKTAQTSTCIHTKRRVALYRFGHSSVPCRQRPIPHPAGHSIADFEETQPSHMQAQWSPRKPIGRTPNVILAKSCAHQEAARRSIKNSTISDSIVRGRALGEHAVAFNAGIGSDSGDPPVGGWPRVGPERLADGFRRRHAARVDELEGALRSRIMAQPSTCRCAASRTRVRRRPST